MYLHGNSGYQSPYTCPFWTHPRSLKKIDCSQSKDMVCDPYPCPTQTRGIIAKNTLKVLKQPSFLDLRKKTLEINSVQLHNKH